MVATALVLALSAAPGATAAPRLHDDRWLFDLDSRAPSDLLVEAVATVAPGQLGVIGAVLGLRNRPAEAPTGVGAGYFVTFGARRFSGVGVAAGGVERDVCQAPLTCRVSADGRRVWFSLEIRSYGTEFHTTAYLFVRAASVRFTTRRLGRWRAAHRAGEFAVVTEDATATAQAQDRRVTAGPLTYTASSPRSIAIAGVGCDVDDTAYTVLAGAQGYATQVCPDAIVSRMASSPTTWVAQVLGARLDHRPALLLVAVLHDDGR